VVDVEARAVGEHGVGEVRLDHRCHARDRRHPARVETRALVFEVPRGALGDRRGVGVDERARRADGVRVRTGGLDRILGLDAEDLGDAHLPLEVLAGADVLD
jgi:hypothetical protein